MLSTELQATRAPLAHDGESRVFHLLDGRSIHLTRNTATDFRVVVLDFTGQVIDPAYARNESTEAAAREFARGVFCELTGRTVPAQRVNKTRFTVVDDRKVWAARGAKPAAKPAQDILVPITWPRAARAGQTQHLSEPGLKVLLAAMADPSGFVDSRHNHVAASFDPLYDRGWLVPLIEKDSSGRIGIRKRGQITCNGAKRALKELADLAEATAKRARIARYTQITAELAAA